MTPDDVETVLTFGGRGGGRFHIAVRRDGELQAVCGQYGRNPLLKDRVVIESHYDPCSNCFAPGRTVPADAVTSREPDEAVPDGGREVPPADYDVRGPRPGDAADGLSEILFDFDELDYNAFLDEDLKQLLEHRDALQEMCERYRHDQHAGERGRGR